MGINYKKKETQQTDLWRYLTHNYSGEDMGFEKFGSRIFSQIPYIPELWIWYDTLFQPNRNAQ